MERRTFLRNTAIGGLAFTLPSFSGMAENAMVDKGIPHRKLGRASDKLSILGFGSIMLNNNTQEFANDNVAKAYDEGINYFDVAPSYGNAQQKLGPALKPYRDNCFLACKTNKRDNAGAQKELEESLRFLETDHFDLYQLHALTTIEDVEKAFGPSGAMEVLLKAKQDGKVRYLGFSAHSEEAALLALEKFDFDTILFPINFVCWHTGNFGPKVYEKAKERNMGILALKSMALTHLKDGEEKIFPNCWYRPLMDDETLSLGFRYTLSKDITAAVSPGASELFWKGVNIAKRFSAITSEENNKLLALAKETEPVFKS